MKGWFIGAVALGLGMLAGCGGGSSSSNNNNLTPAQAQQLGNEAFTDVSNALAGGLGSTKLPLAISSRDHMRVALRRDTRAETAAKPESLNCNSAFTSCAISDNYTCPDGGSLAISGNFTVNTTGNSASGTIDATPSNCSDGTLVLNGNPDLTVGVQGNDNGVSTNVSVALGGGVNFAPVQTGQFPTGSCSCNVIASITVNDSNGSVTACSISGTVCGQAINANCSVP